MLMPKGPQGQKRPADARLPEICGNICFGGLKRRAI